MSIDRVWIERAVDDDLVQQLSNDLNISLLLSRLLIARDISEAAVAKDFLSPSLKNLIDPLSFADMDKAIIRIADAIAKNEVIGIFGDYDVDGVCSSAILRDFLAALSASIVVTLPHRLHEGYGLSKVGIDRLRQKNASLIITADCGSMSFDEIDYARAQGLDVIVVDHHNISEKLPNAVAVVNPKRHDCLSQATYLCAAGVSFFLCAALRRYLRQQGKLESRPEPELKKLLDLVALATVCDVVPLIKDNRSLVKTGLSIIKSGERLGLRALMDGCQIDKAKISATNLGFHLGPRINAAGRLEDATTALNLLTSSNDDEARSLASILHLNNEERRDIEEETLRQIVAMIDADDAMRNQSILVFYDEAWHIGVVGIIASRIAERYHRPTIVIGKNGKGSGRSIRGIDLHQMVEKAKRHLLGFGGHAHAIGISLRGENFAAFRRDLLAVVDTSVPKTVFDKILYYDAILTISECNLMTIADLEKLEPYGAKNPYPVVKINRCFVRNLRRLAQGHIKGEVETLDGAVGFIGFRMDIDDDLANAALDILAVLEKNEWQGNVRPQLRIIDYKKSELP